VDSGVGPDKTHRHNPMEGPDGPMGPWHLTLFLPPFATTLAIANMKAIIEVHQTHGARAPNSWCPCCSLYQWGSNKWDPTAP